MELLQGVLSSPPAPCAKQDTKRKSRGTQKVFLYGITIRPVGHSAEMSNPKKVGGILARRPEPDRIRLPPALSPRLFGALRITGPYLVLPGGIGNLKSFARAV